MRFFDDHPGAHGTTNPSPSITQQSQTQTRPAESVERPHKPQLADQFAQALEHHAKALGFERVGWIAIETLESERERLNQWLAAGHHAGMEWMTRHLEHRLSPEKLFPAAQSVVCVAINYYPGEAEASAPPAALKIARYAMGRDYHKLIRGRLRQLLRLLQEAFPELALTGRALADSAPLLERALAERAGLGWRGKHGLLITPNRGSWVFLGELLLSYPVPEPKNPLVAAPVPDYCGRCTRCIDACPTQAILPERSVDARRCIAYWTIESDAETLPEHITSNQENWIFGCDICQEVCPWNTKLAQPTQEPLWQTLETHTTPPDYWLTLDETGFEQRFGRTPLRRTGLTRLKRNVSAATRTYTALKRK
ncbi:MAG: tRNA epoxyqueuosine(34) reductase QueG [Vampirovibrionales bacterium]|nr:tRNA epoxyqueuosine(34) reductase QueG [Vampirovibrionales bacterium]